MGRDEGVTKNYTIADSTSLINGLNPYQQSIIDKMRANSQAWVSSSEEERGALHDKNVNHAKELAKLLGLKYGSTDGLWYDEGKGKWYRMYNGEPTPLYHTGKISKESQKAFDIINNTLKPDEEVAILKTNENVITMEQMQEWAKNILLYTPSLSSIPNSISHGLRALDRSMHSATNNLESNIDNSKHLNIEKISIGANNAVTKSDVKSGVYGAMKKVGKSN